MWVGLPSKTWSDNVRLDAAVSSFDARDTELAKKKKKSLRFSLLKVNGAREIRAVFSVRRQKSSFPFEMTSARMSKTAHGNQKNKFVKVLDFVDIQRRRRGGNFAKIACDRNFCIWNNVCLTSIRFWNETFVIPIPLLVGIVQ